MLRLDYGRAAVKVLRFMDLESINIAAYSTEYALQQVQQEGGVKMLKGSLDQKEAVVMKLLEGVQNTRAPEQTGQRLNISA